MISLIICRVRPPCLPVGTGIMPYRIVLEQNAFVSSQVSDERRCKQKTKEIAF